MTIVNNETISKLIGKDIAEFAIGDDITASYVRHLRDENLRLRAEVEEANENASWWKSRYEAARRIIKSSNIIYGLDTDGKGNVIKKDDKQN